jgi:hypothetical protein
MQDNITEPPRQFSKEIPNEIRGWNWGAFLLNWIWGLGNRTYIALLCLVPFVGIVMMFVLGAKGNKWAWQNNNWRDVSHFKKTQRRWAFAGLLVWIVFIALWFGIYELARTMVKSSDAYHLATTTALQSTELQSDLGAPLKLDRFIGGNIKIENGYGDAAVRFKISGSEHAATVYTTLEKANGPWQIDIMRVDIPDLHKQIDMSDQ